MRTFRLLLVMGLLPLLALASPAAAAKSFVWQRVDTSVQVRADGTLHVVEALEVGHAPSVRIVAATSPRATSPDRSARSLGGPVDGRERPPYDAAAPDGGTGSRRGATSTIRPHPTEATTARRT